MDHAAAIGTLEADVAAQMGLPAGIAVAAPPHDQHAAALGAGVTDADQAMLSTGTAWVVFMRTAEARLDLGPRLFRAPSVDGEGWGLIRALSAGGGYLDRAMSWLGVSDYDEAERLAGAAQPDAGGVVFLPMLGEQRSAAWLGLGLSNQRGDLLRAVMNGLAGEAVATASAMTGGAAMRKLIMLGGAAHSGLWRRIVASMAGCAVEVPATVDAAALGAAVMGGMAAGWWPSPAAGRARVALSAAITAPEPWGVACQRRFAEVRADGQQLAKIQSGPDVGDHP
jgi:sugar (pentulose or hexulose) kinase